MDGRRGAAVKGPGESPRPIWIAPCHAHDAFDGDDERASGLYRPERREIIPSDPGCWVVFFEQPPLDEETAESARRLLGSVPALDRRFDLHFDTFEVAQEVAWSVPGSWPRVEAWEIVILPKDHPSEVKARREIQRILSVVAKSRARLIAAERSASVVRAARVEEGGIWSHSAFGRAFSEAFEVARSEYMGVLEEARRRVDEIRGRPYPWVAEVGR